MSIERLLKPIELAGVKPGGNSWDAITNQQLKRMLSSLWWISICPGIMYQLPPPPSDCGLFPSF